MTLSSETVKVSYDGNGATTAFPVTFIFWDDEDILAVLRSSAGIETTWTQGTHYTLTGGSGAIGTLTAITAPATGEKLVIKSNRADTQEASFPLGGPFASTATERAFDQTVRLVQQLGEGVDRSLKIPLTDSEGLDMDLPTSDARAGKYWVWDAQGEPGVASGTGNDSALRTDLATSSSAVMGDALVAIKRTAANAQATTLHSWMESQPFNVMTDFGAVGDGVTNDYTAISRAITAASLVGGTVVFPPTTTGYKILTKLTVSASITLLGLGCGRSTDAGSISAWIKCTTDITALEFTNAASGATMRNLAVFGPGTGTSTLPGVIINNCTIHGIDSCSVQAFDIGTQYKGASSFSCWIRDSQIMKNKTINIDAQANTNALVVENVTFGGGTLKGIKCVDSTDMDVIGGDCEGIVQCCIDIDATVALEAGHTVTGVHFENNDSTLGDIRIGATAAVTGNLIIGNFFKPDAADSAINAILGSCVLAGNVQRGGYGGGSALALVGFARVAAGFQFDMLSHSGNTGLRNDVFVNYRSGSTLSYAAPSTYDAAYVDGARYNLYKINSGSLVAAKNYGSLDVFDIQNSGAAGAGARCYARIARINNAYGSDLARGLYTQGFDCDVLPASFGQSATAPVITNGTTIATASVSSVARVAPGGAVTGIILQSGTRDGQTCWVVNESTGASTVTFAASGTSHVADGVTTVIAGLRSGHFVWDSSTSLWYRT